MIKEIIYSRRMTISNMNKKDLDFIHDMYQDVNYYFYATGSHTCLDKEEFEEFIEQDDNINSFFCISKLFDTNDYVGCIKGNVYYNKTKILWIASIMVDRKFLRQGYGTELVNEMIRFFKLKHNVKHVYISIAQKNEIGIKFWRNLGFSLCKIVRRYGPKKLMFGDVYIYCKSA